MEINTDLKLAVLIDADNVSYEYIRGMMEEIAKYGTPTFKRIYGDWTMPQLSGWKKVLLENAITPVQQYSYTSGKNSTDSALIIEAMDMLYTGGVDVFCIVSSDSDFTRLAIRLRESGKKVIGIGEKKTPAPFITACNKFIYLEILAKENITEPSPKQSAGRKSKLPVKKSTIGRELVQLISASINDIADEDGWVFLGTLGSLLLKKQPDFDPRNYGFKKLLDIMKNIPTIEIEERSTGKSRVSHFYVRTK